MTPRAARNGPEMPGWRMLALYRLRLATRDPTTLLGLIMAVAFAWLIVVPIASILLDAVQTQLGDTRRTGSPVGEWTAYYLNRTLVSPIAIALFWQPLWNTLSIAVGAICISVVVGGSLGWLVSRSDMFGRRWFATALIIPYMLPAWTFALAWKTLFRNRTVGGQQGWLEALGFSPPDWLAYGQVPITIILALHYSPFMILLLGNALRRLDSQLEESARILGASPGRIAVSIIMPLMRPALVSAIVLIFAKCIGEFGVTYILGLPVNFDVLATSLYRAFYSRQTGVGGVLAAVIMLLGVISLLFDAWLLREGRRFVTVGSKGSMERLSRLGGWRWPATVFAAAMFLVSVGLPVLTLFLSTVMRLPARFTPENFTLDFWIGRDLATVALPQGILLTAEFWHAVSNTLWIVGCASLAAGLLGLLVGYTVVRTPFRTLASFLREVTFFPYLVPGIAFGAAYLSLFAVPHGPVPALYGTIWVLMLALMSEQMPYASRAGISAMMQLGKEPEEAAQVIGAGWWRRMAHIVVPIQKGALVTGVLLPFIAGIKGLSLYVILATPATDVLTTYSLRLLDFDYTQAANAVVLMIAALAYGGTVLAQKLTRTNLSAGLGG